ncbi:MAG TPA: sigma-54-dependent Fis family transcriptional regulator [Caldithrix abyssi]|uniref:Sigma-54-dependent Fis family transcriptional regulator n=1 Tax=Caldithrix abyssi TaxID=187145 RepID=A0A7V5PMY6_CALAY|nr:sigma-54-dependent Fis family transcriptional regulator [Caldithrix abyssi]
MSPLTLLIVDDQIEILNALQRLFRKDFRVLVAESGKQALKLLSENEVAVILCDQRMPEMDGVTFLSLAKEQQPDAVRLMITGYADIEATIDAVNKAGIHQYISKPFEPDDLKQIVRNAAEKYLLIKKNRQLQEELRRANRQLAREKEALQQQVEQQLDVGNFIGHSPKILEVLKLVEKVVNTPTTVLLLGETGTGKELLAKIIHYNSNRREHLFVAQNCGAIPDTLLQSELFGHVKGAFTGAVSDKKGLFELADKGTIFLDEIGDTSPAFQLGLLRVLQEGEVKPLGSNETRKVDVRVIAATNRDLEKDVREGRFREDLYYRLSVFPIVLPPLSQRREDIPDLVEFFLQKYTKRINKPVKGIAPETLEKLVQADYPGNIRELENEIERMVTLVEPGETIDDRVLSARFLRQAEQIPLTVATDNLKQAVERLEKTMITRALEETGGNILRSAEKLGVSRVGLHKMLKRHGIETHSFKIKGTLK